jgi:hypothetical protein
MAAMCRLAGMGLLAAASGCSTFERDWKHPAETPPAAPNLAGRWEGQWISDATGHSGRLRCIIEGDEPQFLARFKARYSGIFTFSYDVKLEAEKVEGHRREFQGSADLGSLAGGMYHYKGHVEGDAFCSTYTCKYDHGRFEMQRVHEPPEKERP